MARFVGFSKNLATEPQRARRFRLVFFVGFACTVAGTRVFSVVKGFLATPEVLVMGVVGLRFN